MRAADEEDPGSTRPAPPRPAPANAPPPLLWAQAYAQLPRAQRWRPPWPSWVWAAPLFVLTVVTTMVIGARLHFDFVRGLPSYYSKYDLYPFGWIWHHPAALAGGLGFSAALMGILLAHELGHFLACRYYRLDSTLPLFLPAPTLIGTWGAFIKIKMPFHDRREVFDIGIAGPLAGLALTLPLLAYGMARSHVLTAAQVPLWQDQFLHFGWPPLVAWFAAWLHPGIPAGRIALSPVARAAWVGLFVTMLNLIPGAQLDGGHVLYAIWPRAHAVISWMAMLGLVAAGWFFWPGWYIFAAFIALMRVRHPAVPALEPLDTRRRMLALLCLVVFAVTFVPMPLLT
ncbi:MAG: site-2 protease family protein [Terriglobales bacterium]